MVNISENKMIVSTAKNKLRYTPSFCAQFWHSEDLKQIALYAKENKCFESLNQARKNIDNVYLTNRLIVEVGTKEKGNPFIKFLRFRPKSGVVAITKNDYEKVRELVVTSSNKKQNPLDFAMKQIIRLGSDVPNNNLFRRLFK